MLEYIIEVDEYDKEIGPIEKNNAHYKGILHRAFSIFIFNSNNQLLIQKRHGKKYHSPGLWTNTCCSHPRYSEILEDAIYRRLEEEMGFTCKLTEKFSFVYKVELEENLFENEYDHVFFGKYDGEVNSNKIEVEAFKWVNLEELQVDIINNPQLYTYWFKRILNKVVNEYKDNIRS